MQKNNMPRGKTSKRIKEVEFFLAIIIAIVLIGTLLSQNYLNVPFKLIASLIATFIVIKVFIIAREKGTIIEDYTSLALIIIFWLIYLTTKTTINTTILIVIILTLLYSVKIIPTMGKITKSQSIVSFLISYVIFIIAIILLFGGIYFSNNYAFSSNGENIQITFEDALYFSTITFTTVGYGDIEPEGINKLISSIEAIMAIVLNIAFIGYILASRKFLPEQKKPNQIILMPKK